MGEESFFRLLALLGDVMAFALAFFGGDGVVFFFGGVRVDGVVVLVVAGGMLLLQH